MPDFYLVTGGAGFIGSHIVERLLRDGRSVRVIDDLSTGRRENIAPFIGEIEFIEGDVRDLDPVRDAMDGVRYVFHQAAIPSVPRSVDDPLATNAANVDGTLNVLVAARDAGVKRVVYASSSAVYGDSPDLPKRESMNPEPRSPYAVSKLAGELYCRVFYDVYGLETVALRYFNVFGPRQDPASEYSAVVPKFITAFLSGEPPTIYGDGGQSRDFVYVDDVVEANLLAAGSSALGGKVFNVASGKGITINDLAWILGEITGADLEPVHAPPVPGDIRESLADISKACGSLGYASKVGIREGLRKTVEWYEKRAR